MVREQEASPEVHSIYEELKEALGLPQVNIVFQAYAAFPVFFRVQWERFKPVLQSQQFFQVTERLRADAYTRTHNYFDIPDFCEYVDSLKFSVGAKHELKETTELFDYNDPLLFLITSAQQQAFEGPVGSGQKPTPAISHPVFQQRSVLVEEASASKEVLDIYGEIKHDLDIPMVISDFRAIARWPDFLRVYWNVLRPIISSPIYQQAMYGLLESAWGIVQELPGTIETTVAQLAEAGMDEDDIASVVRLTRAFNRGLAGSMLNISIAKIGLEGGNQRKKTEAPDEAAGQSKGSPTRAA